MISSGTSVAFFIVMRRMRIPLIVLIVVFAISILGLTLIDGQSPNGPWRMGFFDAFYFMSYTATTIGFGEIPEAFNDAQRMWVTLSIYLSVIGWAYAIGTLLGLLQDRGFKRALAIQRFRRRVGRINEPFWVMAGHGQTGELLGQWLDALGRRFVAVDLDPQRVDALELGSYRSDVPALAADARDPGVLVLAGLQSPKCEGVLALTDDDEANLAVLMSAWVMRSNLPVIARSTDPAITNRMSVFGSPTIINPFDRFGDHFRIELRAPAVEQLCHWLMSAPGAPMPQRHHNLQAGHWIVCGYGRFGSELTRDLLSSGVDVVVIDSREVVIDTDASDPASPASVTWLTGDGTDPQLLAQARLVQAAGFVAGTDNDITNLSLVEAARRVNPSIFVVGRQNRPMNAELFVAMDLDMTMVPSRVVAEEALAHIGTPQLWQFLQRLSAQDDAWAADLIARIVRTSGDGSPDLWVVTVNAAEAPALVRAMARYPACVGDMTRDPVNRDDALPVTALMRIRADECLLAPAADLPLALGDAVLFAGQAEAKLDQRSMLSSDEACGYVLTGVDLPSSWVLRQFSRRRQRHGAGS